MFSDCVQLGPFRPRVRSVIQGVFRPLNERTVNRLDGPQIGATLMNEGPLPRKPLASDVRRELLGQLKELSAMMCDGHQAFADRVDELGGGFPARGGHGGGGSGKGTASKPTERAVVGTGEPESERQAIAVATDVAEAILVDYDRSLVRAERQARQLWELHARHSSPQLGVERMSNPGCWSCARIPGAWRQTYATVEVEITEAKAKRKVTTKRKVGLCQWCYHFWCPSGQDRMPTYLEVEAHLGGKRVMVVA